MNEIPLIFLVKKYIKTITIERYPYSQNQFLKAFYKVFDAFSRRILIKIKTNKLGVGFLRFEMVVNAILGK